MLSNGECFSGISLAFLPPDTEKVGVEPAWVQPETLYHTIRDDAFLYIAYVAGLHLSLLIGGTAVCGHSLHLGLTGTPPSSRDKLCPDSTLQV